MSPIPRPSNCPHPKLEHPSSGAFITGTGPGSWLRQSRFLIFRNRRFVNSSYDMFSTIPRKSRFSDLHTTILDRKSSSRDSRSIDAVASLADVGGNRTPSLFLCSDKLITSPANTGDLPLEFSSSFATGPAVQDRYSVLMRRRPCYTSMFPHKANC